MMKHNPVRYLKRADTPVEKKTAKYPVWVLENQPAKIIPSGIQCGQKRMNPHKCESRRDGICRYAYRNCPLINFAPTAQLVGGNVCVFYPQVMPNGIIGLSAWVVVNIVTCGWWPIKGGYAKLYGDNIIPSGI
jgi:hypothetical protein